MKAVTRPPRVRCAVYTRKSSEEGLEQAFNSLDAQAEACAAYILSQASEGWVQVAESYDDGGLSGGTLERPALQRLLADVREGRIDIIVVYKVDRLTRSLLDFAKLVEAFDKASVSFVSVTQSFNTTTSMGRLTLNMLLSFAQFEREVTAERIRDKIAASKARGMWMGGIPPLGYKPDGRSLEVVDEHAAIVRHIFSRYARLRNVRLLADELRRDRILVPARVTQSGKAIGGGFFSRGLLHEMLRRVTYAGQIRHGSKVFAGNHPAIIEHELFERVQQMISSNLQGERKAPPRRSTSLLAGRVVNPAGEPLIATHACKSGRRYRYYVSRALHTKDAERGLRIPAKELEALVTEHVAKLFDDPLELAGNLNAAPQQLVQLHERGTRIAAGLRHQPQIDLPALLAEVRIMDAQVLIDCDPAEVARLLELSAPPADAPRVRIVADARVTRSGMAVRLVQSNGAAQPVLDTSLIKQIARAHRWWAQLRLGKQTVTELAAREGVSPAYLTRILRLVYLAPAVVEALMAGQQRAGISARDLTLKVEIPALWGEQKVMMMPGARSS